MNSEKEQDVKYTSFKDLPQIPKTKQEIFKTIKTGFEASETEWKQHFDTITLLRSINKYQPDLYIKELFPQVLKSIITNVEGLRSKLSKEALTLLFQTIKYNNLQFINDPTLNLLVESLFRISNSEKKFIKQQARAAITELQNTRHPGIYFQLAAITLNNNFNISQLAIGSLKRKVSKDMISPKSPNFNNFLKLLIGNLNAGRAVLEKTAKEILNTIRNSVTDHVFRSQILTAAGLSQQEQKLINSSLAQKQKKEVGSFKDFLKNKKQGKNGE